VRAAEAEEGVTVAGVAGEAFPNMQGIVWDILKGSGSSLILFVMIQQKAALSMLHSLKEKALNQNGYRENER